MSNKKLNPICEEVISLVESKNFDEVIKITNIILKDDPKSNFALFNKAFALEKINENKLALDNYDLLLEVHEKDYDNYDALYNKGLIHGKLGDYENAEKSTGGHHWQSHDSLVLRRLLTARICAQFTKWYNTGTGWFPTHLGHGEFTFIF